MESDLGHEIQVWLTRLGATVLKIHGEPMQPKAVDYLACYRGVFIAIETKIWPRRAEHHQIEYLRRVRTSGGIPVLAYNVFAVEHAIERAERRFLA